MAYRRLPNTDNARLIAMVKLNEQLLVNGNVLRKHQSKIIALKNALTELISRRKQLVMKRTLLNKEKKELLTSLKLYVSHFFQVLNFAIDRGDISKTCRTCFSLDVNTGIIPPLSKELAIMIWARNILVGERKRVVDGVIAISHPNHKKIEGLLEVAENCFEDLKMLEEEFQNYHKEIGVQRNKIDAFIKQVWNEVEHQFINEPIEIKREKAAQFGVVYVI